MMLQWMLERLRPVSYTRVWEYAVVWRLGDDPSGVLEWVGCSCCGAKFDDTTTKGEEEYCRREHEGHGGLNSVSFCRDDYLRHKTRTNACVELASIPTSLPLCSGLHGEVLLLNQPVWINGGTFIENYLNESCGTRVLIPVLGGVVELFNEKDMPQDKGIIELVISQSQFFSDVLSVDYSRKYSPAIHFQSLDYSALLQCRANDPRKSQLPSPGRAHKSCCATLESNSKDSSRVGTMKHPNGENCFQSKNLMTERKRRQRIKDRLFTLRSLVPNISKMDNSAIIGDAIVYIKKLQKEIIELREEIRKLDDEDRKDEAAKWKLGSLMEDNQDRFSSIDPKRDTEVEVNKIGEKGVLVRLVCKKIQGWFCRVMAKLGAFGLAVKDVNVTTLDGKVLAILMLEALEKDGVQMATVTELRDSLMKVVG